MMRHEITHRFHSTLAFSFKCQICDRPMLYCVKCKYCKYLCHKTCAARAPPSCGLPDEFVNMFKSIQTTRTSEEIDWTSGQNSITAAEWEIPRSELIQLEEIGRGNFGCDKVIKGYWHGDVAIKMIEPPKSILEDEKTYELMKQMFKEEVANFRNTRHDNLEIFMGACMDSPGMAIITTFCKGETLHSQIYLPPDQLHIQRKNFTLNKIIHIAQQICLGMGYLHSRNIVHKDLTTKNIFFDNGQVVITDFGLFSLKRMCRDTRHGDEKPWLALPRGWLPYLAPELMRKLDARKGSHCNYLNFTFSSDVYAFGTIWYELMTGQLPFQGLPEIVIWQVGRGLKQPLINVQAPREMMNLLLLCWSVDRPKFQDLNNLLEALPRKRFQRSSSFCAG